MKLQIKAGFKLISFLVPLFLRDVRQNTICRDSTTASFFYNEEQVKKDSFYRTKKKLQHKLIEGTFAF